MVTGDPERTRISLSIQKECANVCRWLCFVTALVLGFACPRKGLPMPGSVPGTVYTCICKRAHAVVRVNIHAGTHIHMFYANIKCETQQDLPHTMYICSFKTPSVRST